MIAQKVPEMLLSISGTFLFRFPGAAAKQIYSNFY
jgi:hypothetical protein